MQIPEENKRSVLTKIFYSPEERRLRAGWRISMQSILMMVFMVCGGILQFAITGFGNINSFLDVFLGQIGFAIGATISIFLTRRWLDKRTFTSLGLGISLQGLRDITFGFLLGFLLTGLIFLTGTISGWTQIEGFSWQVKNPLLVFGEFSLAFLFFVLVGWTEEILARGYWLQNLVDGTNMLAAVLISSSLFSLLHIINPGFSWMASLGIFAAGLLFAYSYLKTRQLWLAIGLHTGWNFFLGPVFGYQVSGIGINSLVNQTTSGPTLWTGGEFGPEAGLVIFPVLLFGGLLIHLYTRLQRSRTVR